MLGIRGRSEKRSPGKKVPDDEPSIQGVASLLGGDGVSLNGESVQLPGDANYRYQDNDDDISSLNTSVYGGGAAGAATGKTFRILGPGDAPVDPIGKTIGDESAGEKERNEEDPAKGRGAGCCPAWITEAQPWLKGVIVLSVALLVGAIVLIGVAAGLATADDKKTADASLGSTIILSPSLPMVPFALPTIAPSSSISPTIPATTMEPTTQRPTVMPFEGQTQEPTSKPSVSPSESPTTLVPSFQPSFVPTPIPTLVATFAPVMDLETLAPGLDSQTETPAVVSSTKTVFYVTGGRVQDGALGQVMDSLQKLPTESDAFMVHLGDWNSPFTTQCDEASYQDVSDLYSLSSVPVYFVPADNEYNDCPNPDEAADFWNEYLVNYETTWWDRTPYIVSRNDPEHSENFAFVMKQVLFIGINLVGGRIPDQTEWTDRLQANLDWIDESLARNRADVLLMVIFAHSDPTIQSNAPFFTVFQDKILNEYNVATMLFHRNLGTETWAIQQSYGGIEAFWVVIVEGGIWPPMRVEIDMVEQILLFDQGTWFDLLVLG